MSSKLTREQIRAFCERQTAASFRLEFGMTCTDDCFCCCERDCSCEGRPNCSPECGCRCNNEDDL